MNNLTYDDTLKNIVDKVNQNNSELSTKSSKLDWKIMTDAVDLNTMITDGRYLLKGTITNGYTGVSGWHYLIVESIPNNNRVTQIIWHDDGTEAYTRRLKSDGTWTSWLLESNTSNAVSVINQSIEGIKISADKVDIDGLVNYNNGNNAITNRIGEVETDINNRISATNQKVTVNSTNISNEVKRATDKENELNTKVEDYHSEVVDARSGYDGTKYGTLGDSIRKQFEGFKLENLRVGGRNLLASRNIIENAFIMNGLSLEDGNDGRHYAYNLIEAKEGDKFTITSYADTNDTVVGFFNSNKTCNERENNFIKGQPKTVVVPEGAVYIAVSLPNKYPHGLCKLERYSIPTDNTPAPEDIEDKIIKVNTRVNEITTTVASINTKMENKLSNCDLILDTSFSASGIINIPISKTYSFYTIIIKGDDNNGITFTIPKYVMDNYYSPFYLDATALTATGYSIKVDGRVYNKAIEIKSVSLTGWTEVAVNVFGVY